MLSLFQDGYRYGEVGSVLAMKELKVRYKRSFLRPLAGQPGGVHMSLLRSKLTGPDWSDDVHWGPWTSPLS